MTAVGRAPTGPVRLLAGYERTGRPARLAEHLDRYGPMPPSAGRSDPWLIDMAAAAGLAGRGGAWFPTATKMHAVAAGRGRRVVVANGVESEPASGKDRLLAEVAPHLILDGATLAARAVGAEEVIIAVPSGEGVASRLEDAVEDRLTVGCDRYPIRVERCPRWYVASEETALIRHLNHGPALPTFTPPRPFQKGVAGRPTLVNNVETLAHLALLARYGPDWFRAVGPADAPGSTLVTVAGAVAGPGVYEVPLGSRITEVIGLAGGATEPVQAVLAGGYFGSWLPGAALDTPLTPADLRRGGGLLGAGVLVVLPETGCGLAQTARILTWLAEQSAGQCGPCVFGLPAIAADLAAVATGREAASAGTVRRLRDRLTVITGRGACHHPDGAVRLAASALRVFAADLDSHLRGRPCLGSRQPPLVPIPSAPATMGRSA